MKQRKSMLAVAGAVAVLLMVHGCGPPKARDEQADADQQISPADIELRHQQLLERTGAFTTADEMARLRDDITEFLQVSKDYQKSEELRQTVLQRGILITEKAFQEGQEENAVALSEQLQQIDAQDARVARLAGLAEDIRNRPSVRLNGFWGTEGGTIAMIKVKHPGQEREESARVREGEEFGRGYVLEKILVDEFGRREGVRIVWQSTGTVKELYLSSRVGRSRTASQNRQPSAGAPPEQPATSP